MRMQLTKRFFAMNALAMLGSFAITFLAVAVFAAAYTKMGGSEASLGAMQRNLEIRSAIGEIKNASAKLSFDQLLEERHLQRLTERVELVGANAVIVRDRTVLYSAAPIRPVDVERSLLLSDSASEPDTIELGGKLYMFAKADYALSSGETGALLLLAPVQVRTSFYVLLLVITFGVFFLTFLLLNLGVTSWFARGVIAPVSRLRAAAASISEGDLQGGIAEEGEGEVRELSRTLELMRMKLKESIRLQRKYDENRSFLVSSISHDLKTPVTSIQGYIEGILDGVARTPEKTREYLETARSKAMLMNAMIDDLLLYSKLDLNQLPYHMERTDLARYFEDCVADQRYEYEAANLTLTLRNELEGTVCVLMDRERMKRVVQNILDNAKKYMGKSDGGEVEVILRATLSSAVIEIRDNGRGISEEHLSHLFDRFYRADASRSGAEGSGLGLAIAKQIVEGHEGKIWVRSQVGEGTRFMISLRTL